MLYVCEIFPSQRPPRSLFIKPGPECRYRHLGFCALLGLAILMCGCSFGKTKKDASVKAAKNVTSPTAELSARNQSLLGIYSAEIETAADKIMFQTPSTAGRRQALAWKAESDSDSAEHHVED